MIIGTAGHIDHGKSALVEALTGQRMDRLAEERRRGITVDLNFASLTLADGRVAGIVDVPGHEDLVRTMVAGATGLDVLLLVVAADEGMMPQTAEHLAIAEQLGIATGIPVLSKVDLVEDEWCALVEDDLAQRLAASPIDFRPPVRVSAPSGEGLDTLRRVLEEVLTAIPDRPTDDLFRLPVDRSFSLAGVGTVVTGTCWSGAVAVGDTVSLVPGRREARVRSIEIHGAPEPRSQPGARVALGLAGVDRKEVRRGDTVVESTMPWQAVRAIDVDLALLPSARPMAARRRVRVLAGTAETMARVYPRGTIEPGAHGLARLVCDQPLVVRGGDRLVLRSYSPVLTIGGGVVVDPSPPRRGPAWQEMLSSPEAMERLTAVVGRRPLGAEDGELAILSGLSPSAVTSVAGASKELKRIGSRWTTGTRFDIVARRALGEVEAHHDANPAQRGMPLETLRRSLGRPVWLGEAVIDDLVERGLLERGGGTVWRSGHEARVAGGAEGIDRAVALLEVAGLAPPSVTELGRELERDDIADVLRFAAEEGRVAAVSPDRYYATSRLGDFVAELRRVGDRHDGEISPAAVRESLGLSRKYLIPLLEWADRQGVTRRVGETRLLVGEATAGGA